MTILNESQYIFMKSFFLKAPMEGHWRNGQNAFFPPYCSILLPNEHFASMQGNTILLPSEQFTFIGGNTISLPSEDFALNSFLRKPDIL